MGLEKKICSLFYKDMLACWQIKLHLFLFGEHHIVSVFDMFHEFNSLDI